MAKYLWLCMMVMLPLAAFSQKKADRKMLDNLQQHINQLSEDSSTDGVARYMENQFKDLGLSQMNKSYRQPVISDAGKMYSPGTTLSFNDTLLTAGEDFVPLPFSGQGTVQGSPLIAVQEQNEPWIMDLNNYLDNQPSYPDSQIARLTYQLASQGLNDHARAVLFYSSVGNVSLPATWPETGADSLALPVVFIRPAAAKSFFRDPTASIQINLTVAFHEKKDTAYNIVGRIDNNAPSTVVIGAQGQGDNASLIELGRLLQQDKRFKKENYVLVSFCDAGNGISGQQAFFKNGPLAGASSVRCFINLQHTGKIDALQPVLYVNNPVSPEWNAILEKAKTRDVTIQPDTLSHATSETSWPVLSFSASGGSGLNASGELAVVKYLDGLIKEINRAEK